MPDAPEHRPVFVGTTESLPEHKCDRVPHQGSTIGMARKCTLAIMIALVALVGCAFSPKAPCHSPCVYEAVTSCSGTPVYYDRAPGLTRLGLPDGSATAVGATAVAPTTLGPEGSGGSRPEQDTIGCGRETVQAFPTDAKEREKNRRKKEKEAGKEHKVIKKKKIVEDHHDDCGEDLASLQDDDLVGLTYPDFEAEDRYLAANEYETYQRHFMLYGDPVPAYASGLADGPPREPGDNPPYEATPAKKAPLDSGRKRPTFAECEACAMGRDPWHPTHVRTPGRCWYPDILSRNFTCPGCVRRSNKLQPDHNYRYGECQWGTPDRTARRTRPHELVVSPSTEPTAGLVPQDPDGRPLGTAEEEAIAQADAAAAARERQKERAAGSADAGGLRPPSGGPRLAGSSSDVIADRRDLRLRPPPDIEDDGEDDDGEGPETKRRRKPPVRFEEQGTGTEANHDWTAFDIGNVVRALRTDNEPLLRRVLRKLHLRWWHASEAVMQRFLHRAGVPEKVLRLIPAVTRTCAVCREWAQPGPSNLQCGDPGCIQPASGV